MICNSRHSSLLFNNKIFKMFEIFKMFKSLSPPSAPSQFFNTFSKDLQQFKSTFCKIVTTANKLDCWNCASFPIFYSKSIVPHRLEWGAIEIKVILSNRYLPSRTFVLFQGCWNIQKHWVAVCSFCFLVSLEKFSV